MCVCRGIYVISFRGTVSRCGGCGVIRKRMRALAAIWTEIPAAERTVARLEAESARAGLAGRVDYAEGPELPGVERLASWLTLVRAPKRVFLEVELQGMNRN